jgi:hypothetical protein
MHLKITKNLKIQHKNFFILRICQITFRFDGCILSTDQVKNVKKSFRAYFASAAFAMANINLAISESNTGYANSGVPIRLVLKCVVDSQLNDNSSSVASLYEFTNLAGKKFLIRQFKI